ncbi:site-specific integrase [Pisciglobus halotolerans]|uniref:Site-specific recombinase XerD n=1 Tax=Pisciglobus halotolerans TaxID=745365 RepID=A0A1I3C303_9LACT|nr:site-specific integrase [Pisciglobus halotolerans]SFH68934.1 Site-specific recombinase XerD [Pisciglobus halotolerans]
MESELFVDYFKEWVETYKVGAVRDVTLNKYKMTHRSLSNIVPDLTIDKLDRRVYQKILNEYAKTHEKATTTDFHHQVKACVQDMFHDGILDRDPTYRAIIKGKKPDHRKKNKFLQIDELTKLIRSLDLSNGINSDWLIMIIAKTGLRYAEALALTPADFDFDQNVLHVNKTWKYKSKDGGFVETKTSTSIRTIAIDWQIVGQFRPVIQGMPENEPIFVKKNKDGSYVRQFNSTINGYLERKCKELEITIISIHGLRHTHASVLLAAGVSIHSISARLGHANVTVTQETYAHVLDDLKQKDNQKIIGTLMQIA